MSDRLPAVDAYVAKAPAFAQPILTCLREAVHAGIPDIEEQVKWSRPFFVYKGVILGNMAAFKGHCSFGLWGGEMVERLRAEGVSSSEGMGTFGRITSILDLPEKAKLDAHIRHARDLIGSGTRTKSIQRVAKPSRTEAAMPAALTTVLQEHPAAAESFARLSPSCRREYAEWIGGAKRAETQARRVATAIERIGAGKSLNWKYEARSG